MVPSVDIDEGCVQLDSDPVFMMFHSKDDLEKSIRDTHFNT